jgi:hypothetical protein
MARLLRKNGSDEPEVLELNLGVNHFGRNAENPGGSLVLVVVQATEPIVPATSKIPTSAR